MFKLFVQILRRLEEGRQKNLFEDFETCSRASFLTTVKFQMIFLPFL